MASRCVDGEGAGHPPDPFACSRCVVTAYLAVAYVAAGVFAVCFTAVMAIDASPLSQVVYEAGRSRSHALATLSSGVHSRSPEAIQPFVTAGDGPRPPCRTAAAAGPTDERRRCGARLMRRDSAYRFFAAFFAVFFTAVFFAAAGAAFFAAFLAAAFFAILPPWWRYPISCAVIGTSLQVD